MLEIWGIASELITYLSTLLLFWLTFKWYTLQLPITPSHQSVCLYVYPSIVATQRLGKHVPAATNTRSTIQELLEASFSLLTLSYQTKVGD
jgi:hypothetical protein